MEQTQVAGKRLAVEYRSVKDIRPYDRNPRRNDQAVDAVMRSIQQFGFKQPIVVDADGVIVVGHTRYKAALKLGYTTVPVAVADDLTPEQCKAYRIADNKTAELAEWDIDALSAELAELGNMEDFGFTAEELAKLSGETEEPVGADIDTIVSRFVVIVECRDEAHQEQLYDQLTEQGETCRVSSI